MINQPLSKIMINLISAEIPDPSIYPLAHETVTKSIVKTITGNQRLIIDNRWAVPHNLYLCTKFSAHINVESCASIDAIKYIFKYVNKGHDRASVTLEEKNEIKLYFDAKYVSAPEARWTLFHYHLDKEYPTHQCLQVHLEDEQTIYFDEQEEISSVVQRAAVQETTLTAWMKTNRTNPTARTIFYPNFRNTMYGIIL